MLRSFPQSFGVKAFLAYIFAMVIISLLYFDRRLDWIWIVFGISEVMIFFFAISSATSEWKNLSQSDLLKNLFWWSFIIRVAYVFFSYFFYIYHNDQPFEFLTADALGYHDEARMILDWVQQDQWYKFSTHYKYGFSDMGYPIWLAINYFPSYESIIIARIVNALLSSIMVLQIYNLTKRNFGPDTARISAVIAAFLPTFIFYCGLHLKETVMTFFLVAFIERADALIRSPKLKFWAVFWVVLLGISLFFFRTILAVTAWSALALGLLYTRSRFVNHGNRLIYIVLFFIVATVLFSGRIEFEIKQYSNERSTNQQSQMDNFVNREDGNRFAKYGSATVFAPLVLVAPLPTMVQFDFQLNNIMFNGNIFVKNVLSFFFIFSMVLLFKQKRLKDHILILAVLFSYLAILALSGFALAERFHFPSLPFIVILAGYGITQMKASTVFKFDYYLTGLVLLIIAWNWFKLAGRGIA